MVAVQQHLERAPIQEAIVDIRVRRQEPVSEATYRVLHDSIRDRYPKANELHVRGFRFRATDPDEALEKLRHKVIGYRYVSEQKTYVAQFRNDGFGLSRLQPYETWEGLKQEAKRLWETYLEATQPDAVTRLSVRYINRLVLQFVDHSIDLEDYFLLVPPLPSELPQTAVSVLSQVKLHDLEIGASANISISTLKIEDGGLPVVFDIDVFKGGEFEISQNEYWNALEQLRELKNRIFFSCITSRTLEMIK